MRAYDFIETGYAVTVSCVYNKSMEYHLGRTPILEQPDQEINGYNGVPGFFWTGGLSPNSNWKSHYTG